MIAELPASATLPTLPRQQQQRSRTNSDVEEEEIKDVKTDARDEKSSGGASSAGREDEDVVEVFAPPVAIPWKLKWFALFFTIALPLGQNCE